MEKKILVAVDNSVHAMGAVHYAAQMAAVLPELGFTLLHVQPALSQYLTDEAKGKPSARRALEKLMTENDAKARETLEAAAQRMVRKGVQEGRIEQITTPRNKGVADDILALGSVKSYDAILVGRRGSSHLREWLMGSVTANLVEHSGVIPVWVIDGTVASTKVMLAADGSRSTLRALDHLAFMLSGRPSPKIHILHVRPRFKDYCEIVLEEDASRGAETVLRDEDQQCMDDFHRQALAVLGKNGIDQGALNVTTLDGKLSIPRSIRAYARDNGYGTVVLGRRGRSKSPFVGSVSRGLLQKADDMALWVVP
jgi:nucleotide-binding universal stress UspA family protein